ncbi:amino acid ABC transporter permease [Paracoccus sp. IB05]|uniref:amino acid ABC transporter permease n=1 Tax=Paracoccus sp. IB05 TaxID=2779367 RepID=UPI0018E82300|nr:amino acid ABC transporter permease [Paracoccus sp. IB05]MBJ2150548.1 amino acid ABC transporter permease [Paracoccus sp. IB05]
MWLRPIPEPDARVPGHMDVLLPRRSHQPPALNWREALFNPLTLTLVFAALIASVIGTAWAQDGTPGQASIPSVLLKWTPLLAQGFGYNILISVLSMAVGTLLGVLLGILQVSPVFVIRKFAWLVTQFFRNAPWLVLLFYAILLIPFQVTIFGVTMPFPGWLKAVIGLSLPVMAYMSEYVRGAIQSVPSGQWESAESLGFSRGQTMRMVILPQTVKRILPNWMNLYAVLTMATPLVSIIGVDDIMGYTRSALSAEGRPDVLIPMYLYVLCWFFIYCYPISLMTSRLERRYSVKL